MALPPFAGGFQPWLQRNSDNLLSVGMGLLAGQTPQEQVGQAAANYANQRTLNKTAEYLKSVSPELGAAIENKLISPADAYKLFYQQKLEAQKPRNNLIPVGKNLYDFQNGEWIAPPAGIAAGDDEWGLNPVWGQDANGRTVLGQVSKTGKFKPLDTGDFQPTPVLQNLDTGTAIISQNSRTGAVVNNTPKNLAEAESQKEIGTAQGKAIAAAPGDLQAGLNAKDLITQLKTDPNRERGTGWSSIGNAIPGTAGYDYQNKVDQAKSGAFLTAIQQMRGLGSLSNAEGGAATAAVTRMNTATSEEAFNAALDDYEKIIDQGIARAQAKIRQSNGQVQAPPGAPTGNGNARTTTTGVPWSLEP